MKPLAALVCVCLVWGLAACAGLPGLREDPAEAPPAAATATGTAATSELAAEEYAQQLAYLIERRELEALRPAMHAPFSIAGWRSEGREVNPEAALEELRLIYLAEGSAPVASFEMNPAGLLGGADPLTIFGPEANPVFAFFVEGLGPQAADEALMVIAHNPETGNYSWRGMLVAAGGFDQGLGEDFDQRLAQAFEGRDFEALRGLMKERFSFAAWDTELQEMTAGEAVERLRTDFLAEGAIPKLQSGTDIVALLGGADPLALWGPAATPVRAMYAVGLGANGQDEAVLVIARDMGTGQTYWHGLLYPPEGLFQAGGDPGQAQPTDVKAVQAKDVLNLRSGPGTDFEVLGLLAAGESVQVNGVSADGEWWQVVCALDASGFCWVSADPELTAPVQTP
jgi:hypothetical protein